MLLVGPGTFELVLSADLSHEESASASSPEQATIEVFHNSEAVDKVHLGMGGTHSWWVSNPLLRYPKVGDSVRIVIDGPASMRIDWPLSEV